MHITYTKGSADDVGSAGKAEGTSHLTAIAIAVSVVFIVVAIGIWFGFSQSKQALESVPAAVIPPVVTPQVQQARVYEAIDGLERCHKNTTDVSTPEFRLKRQNCYYAVMTIFATSAVCDLIALDGASSELCRQAEQRFKKDYPQGIPQDDVPVINPSDTGNINTPSGNQNTPTGTNRNATTGNSGGAGNTNSSTNATSGNQNTNTSVTTNANTNVTTNTNTSTGNTNTSSTGDTPPPDTPPGDGALCVNEDGEIILLQHTNSCN